MKTVISAQNELMLGRLRKERRLLNKQKRALLAKGLHAFCLEKDESKLTQVKRLSQQINAITAQIRVIKEVQTEFTAHKIETDYAKREFVAQAYRKS